MILESYVKALLNLIAAEKITVDEIKNAEYKTKVQNRLAAQ